MVNVSSKKLKVDPFEMARVAREAINLGDNYIARPLGYGPTYGRKRIVEKERPPEREYYEEEYVPYAQPQQMEYQPQMPIVKPRPKINLCPLCDNVEICENQSLHIYSCRLYKKPLMGEEYPM